MRNKSIPIFINHKNNVSPMGKIEFIDKRYEQLLASEDWTLGAGYIPKYVDENGETTEAELLEISIIPNEQSRPSKTL